MKRNMVQIIVFIVLWLVLTGLTMRWLPGAGFISVVVAFYLCFYNNWFNEEVVDRISGS